MNRQKIFIIVALILLVLLIGGTFWYFSQKAPSTPTGEQFPGGSGLAAEGGPEAPTPGEQEIFIQRALPRLHELHKAPVAGVRIVETKDKKGAIINLATRYIERGLGHIFETQLSTYAESRVVNETRPHLSEALWGNGGNSVVVRFVDDKDAGTIKTRIINISTSTLSFLQSTSTENSSSGFLKTEEFYLPDHIPFMATSEDDTNSLFYLEGRTGSIATFKNTGISKIFSSDFKEWLPQFPNQKLVTLTTKPSAEVPGHLYFLDPKTNALSKVLSNINGLTTLTSPDGKFVLYSETKRRVPELSLYDVVAKKSYSLYVQTLPEKCTWGKKNPSLVYCAVPQTLSPAEYPDQWYQGILSFSDNLLEINTKTMGTKKVMSPIDFKAPPLDMINLSLSSDDAYLVFINKQTGTPWVYSVVEPLPPPTAAVSTSTSTPTEVTPTSTTTKTSVPPSVITSDMQKLK